MKFERMTVQEYHELIANKGKTKNKYKNKKTKIDGITFDSKREAEYYSELKILKRAGEIKDFELQPKFELQPTFRKNGATHRSITYTADFKIIENNGDIRIIDVKGMETQSFKIKRKLFEYKYKDLTLEIVK